MVFNGNLIPWSWGKKNLSLKREHSSQGDQTPYVALHRNLNDVFDEFFRSFDSETLMPLSEFAQGSMFQPRVEMKESAERVRVSVELPGVDERSLDVFIDSHHLTIKGEKCEEKEDNTSGYYRMERHYGSFERRIPFPCQIDKEKAEANFKRGVLTVTLPKAVLDQEMKKIPVRKG